MRGEDPFPYRRMRVFGDVLLGMDDVRRAIAAACVAAAVACLAIVGSPAGPAAPPAKAALVASGTIALVAAVLWWRGPWPHYRASATFVMFANGSVGLCLLLYSDPLLAMPGTCLFVANGIYISLLHSPKMILAHITWSLGVLSALGTLALIEGQDARLAISMWIALGCAISAPPAILPLIWMPIRQAAWDSMIDPLTGLVNRRGLNHLATRLRSNRAAEFVVCLIDLDRFKEVNDVAGHAAGDDVLRRVSTRMLDQRERLGVIVRLGGEEFVVISDDTSDPEGLGQRLTALVHDPGDPHPVTASIGVVMARGPLRAQRLTSALERADREMYVAKRLGGGQVAFDPVVA